MTGSGTKTLLRQSQLSVLLSLLGITTLAWFYLLSLPRGMEDMTRMGDVMVMANSAAWGGRDFVLMFLMWAVMMVGMMMPSAAPMILMFSRLNRSHQEARPLAPTGSFVAGYIVIWTAFSLAATLLQWGLQNAGVLSPMMASTNAAFGGVVLVAAGIYQWTPFKSACLRHCQTPLGFLMTRWRNGVGGAFRMGVAHGAYCLGCCWILMGLLFVGGVMNLLWVAALAAFVLVEKIAPPGPWLSRIAGTALIAWGGWVLIAAPWGLPL